MSYLRKCDVPIIFGLRAEPKVKFQKDASGKQQIVDAGWLPIAEKMFGFDMLIYALMMPENPGVPVHLKKLEPEFEPFFPVGKQITEESGIALAEWARPKEPPPPLGAVLNAIATMSDKPSRDSAKSLASLLQDDDEIAKAMTAYTARIAALKQTAQGEQG